MSSVETTEGTIPFAVPGIDQPCKTWYTIFGTLSSSKRPLVVLHGGPGVCHYYMLPLRDIAEHYNIPVIMYDQLGCGQSTHLPEKKGAGDFWTVQLYLDELDNLLQHLGIIQDEYDLLGQSWGGMLGACHAVRRPKGLRRLIIADSPADMVSWVKAADGLRSKLPPDVQETLTRCEREGRTETEEYEKAVDVYYARHLCRVSPMPPDLMRSFEDMKRDPTVMLTMNGPSEFFITGTLKTWDIRPELHKIAVPTLLINGRYDEATDDVVQPYFNHIQKVKWVRFAESAHLPQFEERAEFMKAIAAFLE